jgi:hypothetical protein
MLDDVVVVGLLRPGFKDGLGGESKKGVAATHWVTTTIAKNR